MLNEYLDAFREQGASISYDKERNTYYHESEGQFKIYFKKTRVIPISFYRLCIILFIIKCLRQLR